MQQAEMFAHAQRTFVIGNRHTNPTERGFRRGVSVTVNQITLTLRGFASLTRRVSIKLAAVVGYHTLTRRVSEVFAEALALV